MPGKKRKQARFEAMPDPILDSPENIMRALVNTPPKEESDWKYMQEPRDQKEAKSGLR